MTSQPGRPPASILDGLERQILETARTLGRALDDEFAPLGITSRQAQVLGHLLRAGAACQADLARHFGVEPATLCGILRRLERDGWVEHATCRDDRRLRVARPTPKAHTAHAALAARFRRVLGRATRGLADDRVEALLAALEAIRAGLAATDAPGPTADDGSRGRGCPGELPGTSTAGGDARAVRR